MIRRRIFSFIGILLLIAAIAGLALSSFGIVNLWRFEENIAQKLDKTLSLLSTTLDTTTEGLNIAASSLTQANSSLDTLVSTIETTGESVQATVPMIDTLSKVNTVDLPKTISTTQKALKSAQSSAQVIDTTLTIITSIPFLFVEPYNSKTSLSSALEEVSKSLDPIPVSLTSMNESLKNTSNSLSEIHIRFTEIASGIREIKTSLEKAQGLISQYLTVVGQLKQQVTLARENLPGTLIGITWVLTIVLIWLGLTQVGLFAQGLEMMGIPLYQQRVTEQKTKKMTLAE
jgi:methyl-accepting chemotaxis protein